MILLTIIEVVRLYLGYVGNLREKVIPTNIPSWTCLLDAAAEEAAASSIRACMCKPSPPPPPCHQVPELAAFCLLSFMFQLPVLLFFVTDEGILILPLERAVHSLYLAFLLAQILASFLALRTMTRKLTLLFHLRQFGRVESLGHAGMSPVYGSPCRRRRGALPVSPTHHVHR